MRGHETPENHALTILKGFSTVSEEIGKKSRAISVLPLPSSNGMDLLSKFLLEL
jgi:hypothetical protein